MTREIRGPEDLPENSGIGLGATDNEAIRAAGTSWQRSLRANVDGEAAWDDAVSAVLQTLADGSDSVSHLPEDHPNAEEGSDEIARMFAAFALDKVIRDARQVRDADSASRGLAYLETPGQLANENRETFREMLRE